MLTWELTLMKPATRPPFGSRMRLFFFECLFQEFTGFSGVRGRQPDVKCLPKRPKLGPISATNLPLTRSNVFAEGARLGYRYFSE